MKTTLRINQTSKEYKLYIAYWAIMITNFILFVSLLFTYIMYAVMMKDTKQDTPIIDQVLMLSTIITTLIFIIFLLLWIRTCKQIKINQTNKFPIYKINLQTNTIIESWLLFNTYWPITQKVYFRTYSNIGQLEFWLNIADVDYEEKKLFTIIKEMLEKDDLNKLYCLLNEVFHELQNHKPETFNNSRALNIDSIINTINEVNKKIKEKDFIVKQ